MRRRDYPSDLSDEEWAILEPLIPPAKPGGRPRTTDMRQVMNALFYLDRTGAQWRALPHDFPPWSTVWSYFRIWRNDGTWERIHTALREQVRVKQGREPTPSAAIIDSQSIKTSPVRGTERGLDGWKKNLGPQTKRSGRYTGQPPDRQGERCQRLRSARSENDAGASQRPVSPIETSLGR